MSCFFKCEIKNFLFLKYIFIKLYFAKVFYISLKKSFFLNEKCLNSLLPVKLLICHNYLYILCFLNQYKNQMHFVILFLIYLQFRLFFWYQGSIHIRCWTKRMFTRNGKRCACSFRCTPSFFSTSC